jgi:uncharacterized protein
LQLLAVAAVAFLYSAVGHGGATGYLAVLALFGWNHSEMVATVLVLNLAVAGLSFNAYRLQGEYRPGLIWPFLAASVPLAFLGSRLPVDKHLFAVILACALLVSGLRFLLFPALGVSSASGADTQDSVSSPLWLTLAIGGLLGLLSGITGIGGGVFLSPVLILCRWATVRQTSCASALFIVANSLSGLVGRYLDHGLQFSHLWYLLAAAIPAAVAGSYLGAGRFSSNVLRRLLAVVLLIAAAKLFRE